MRICVATIVLLFFSQGMSVAEGIVFPEDSGIIDVTRPPYDAVPDDGHDDTAAIQQALADHPTGNHIFYFPDGTYDVSDVLMRLPEENANRNRNACLELRGTKKRNIFQGQSRDRTILRLMDSVMADFNGAVVNFGQAPAQRFRNAMRDMTVSIGSGHPLAIGVQFNASNQGGMNEVAILSEDPRHVGAIGLDLSHTDEIGPCLIRNLIVDGFDLGIRSAYQSASQTFEHITIRNQRVAGWQNGFSQSVFARGVTSVNDVPAIVNRPIGRGDPGQGKILLVDATLRTPTKAVDGPAIRNHKSLYLRNLQTEGYATAVTRELTAYRGNAGLSGGFVEEYWANGAFENRRGGPYELFPSPDRMLRLQVEESPIVPWDSDFRRWKGPHHFETGQPGSGSGFPNDGTDDTAAIQAAIDSGATTVYLPNGHWDVHGTLILRGNVRRLIGCEARMTGPPDGAGFVRLVNGKPDTVIIERLESGRIHYQQATKRTLVLDGLLGGQFHSAGIDGGDLFLNDVVFSLCTFNRQNVWARQLNLEGDTESSQAVRAKIVNLSANVWILGLKTEDAGTTIFTGNEGRTELLGALHVGGSGNEPRFVTQNSSFSAAVFGGGFSTLAREIRGRDERTGQRTLADVYTAFSGNAITDKEIVIDTEDSRGVELTGDWQTRSGFDGGFLGAGCLHDGNTEKGLKQVRFTVQLPAAGKYEVDLRWVNPVSGFATAAKVPVQIVHTEGEAMRVIDQQSGGGRWNTLGRFQFTRNTPATVTISNERTRGHVVADAVRFRRVSQ